MARSRGDTIRQNVASLFPGSPLPIDQRRLTIGVYDLKALAATEVPVERER